MSIVKKDPRPPPGWPGGDPRWPLDRHGATAGHTRASLRHPETLALHHIPCRAANFAVSSPSSRSERGKSGERVGGGLTERTLRTLRDDSVEHLPRLAWCRLSTTPLPARRRVRATRSYLYSTHQERRISYPLTHSSRYVFLGGAPVVTPVLHAFTSVREAMLPMLSLASGRRGPARLAIHRGALSHCIFIRFYYSHLRKRPVWSPLCRALAAFPS